MSVPIDNSLLVSAIVAPMGSLDTETVAVNCDGLAAVVHSSTAATLWTVLAAAIRGSTAVSVATLAASEH